jgi:branched-chain amino acid transport system permease protein
MALLELKEGQPAYRFYRIALIATAALVLIVIPWLVPSNASVDLWSQAVAFSVAILGLNLIVGVSGQISLGHSAFVGLGAYTTVILVGDYGAPYLATLPISFALCFLAGLVVGLPATRLSGLYLAVITLSIATTFPVIILKFSDFTGGANGKILYELLTPPAWFPFETRTRFAPVAFRYYVILAIAALMFLIAYNLVNSRVGRALKAIRNNAISASTSGVPVARYRTLIFGVSAAFSGVAGSLLMIQNPLATETRFEIFMSLFLLVAVFAGGTVSIAAIPGAFLYVFLPHYAIQWAEHMPFLQGRPGAGSISYVLYGVVLLFFIFLLPGGVADGVSRLWKRVVAVRPALAGKFIGAGHAHNSQAHQSPLLGPDTVPSDVVRRLETNETST